MVVVTCCSLFSDLLLWDGFWGEVFWLVGRSSLFASHILTFFYDYMEDNINDYMEDNINDYIEDNIDDYMEYDINDDIEDDNDIIITSDVEAENHRRYSISSPIVKYP